MARTPTAKQVAELSRDDWEELCRGIAAKLFDAQGVEDRRGKGNGLDMMLVEVDGIVGWQFRRYDGRFGDPQASSLRDSVRLAVERAQSEDSRSLRRFVVWANIDLEPGHGGKTGERERFDRLRASLLKDLNVEVEFFGLTWVRTKLLEYPWLRPDLFENVAKDVLQMKSMLASLQSTLSAMAVAAPIAGVPTRPEADVPPEVKALYELLDQHHSLAALKLAEVLSGRSDAPLWTARIETGRGIAKLQLGRFEEAQSNLERALQAQPNYARALGALIIVREHAGDSNAAAALARQMVDAVPTEAYAWATLLHYDEETRLESVPASIREDADVLAAMGARSLRQGAAEEALGFLERAVLDDADHRERRFLLAQALFAAAERSADPGSLLGRALTELSTLADSLAGADSTLRDATTMFAARIAEDLGQSDEARRWLERGRLLPRLKREVTVQLAQLDLSEGGDARRALMMLSDVPGPDDVSLLAMRARARARLDERDTAISEVRRALAMLLTSPAGEMLEAGVTLANTALELQESTIALSALEHADPSRRELRALVLRARAHGAASQMAESLQAYEGAIRMAPPTIVGKLRYEYAIHLSRQGNDAAAVRALRVDPAPEAVELLVWLLLRTGENLEAETFARPHAEKEAPDVWAIQTMAKIAEARGDEASVVEWLRRASVAKPGSAFSVSYAAALIRSNQLDEARAVLARIDVGAFGVSERLRAVDLLARVGERGRARDIAYGVLHEVPYDAQSQLAWLRLLLNPAMQYQETQPTVVAPGVFVLLDHGQGQQQKVLIADGPEIQPALDEIRADHPIAIELMGKAEGDFVELRGGATPIRSRIAALHHKHFHAFEWAKAQYTSLHPTSLDFHVVSIVNESGEHDFSPLNAQAKEAHEHVERLRSLYENNRLMPLGVIAEGLDMTAVAVYDMMRVRERPRVWVDASDVPTHNGGVPERAVLAATALRTVQLLDLTEAVQGFGVEMLVTPIAIHWLRAERARLEAGARDGLRWLGWDGVSARPVAHEATAEEVGQALADHDRFAQWVGHHCKVAPRSPDWEKERVAHWAHVDVWSFESVLAARDRDAVLIADDLGLRYFGGRFLRVPSIATYGLLAVAHREKLIVDKDFDRSVRRLHALGHWFLPLSSSQLSGAISDAAGCLTPEYEGMLRHIAAPEVTLESSAMCTAVALRELMSRVWSPMTSASVEATLAAYFAERPRQRALSVLSRTVRDLFRFLPLDERRVTALIEAHLRTRP